MDIRSRSLDGRQRARRRTERVLVRGKLDHAGRLLADQFRRLVGRKVGNIIFEVHPDTSWYFQVCLFALARAKKDTRGIELGWQAKAPHIKRPILNGIFYSSKRQITDTCVDLAYLV